MSYTLTQVVARTQAALGDVSGDYWNQTNLLPHINTGYRYLDRVYRAASLPFARARHVLTFPAGTKTLDRTLTVQGLQQLPADFLAPFEIWEKDIGAADTSYVLLARAENQLPDVDQGPSLGVWDWGEGKITFPGATTDRTLRIDYQRGIVDLVNASDELVIDDALDVVAYLGAAEAARSIGQAALSVDLTARGLAILNDLVNIETKVMQRNPRRRSVWGGMSSLSYSGGGGGGSTSSLYVFNVKDYGAKGDGATDDTAKIQAAIDAARVKGGVVFFPLGLYRACGLRLEAGWGVTFRGSGYGYTSIVSWTGTTIRSNGPAGGTVTVTAANGSPTLTVTAGTIDPLWALSNVYVAEGTANYAYQIQSVDVGGGTITLAKNYAGTGGAGLTALVEPTVLTCFSAQQTTIGDLNLDGNNVLGTTLLAIDSNNLPQTSRATGLERISLLHASVGVRIGSSGSLGQQAEGVVVDRVECTEMNAGAKCFWINSNNASMLDFQHVRAMTGDYAFYCQYSGPMIVRSSYGGIGLQTWMSLNAAWDSVTLEDCEHEPTGNVSPFLEILAAPNGAQTITLSHNNVNGPIVDNRAGGYPTNIISNGNLYNVNVRLGDYSRFTSDGDDWAYGAGILKTPLSIVTVLDSTGPLKINPGAKLEVADTTTLAAESLTNGVLTSGTSWSVTGDFALASNAATYTHSSGAGTLTQASATLAIAGKASRLYAFAYTISGASGAPLTFAAATITSAFASLATPILVNTNGTFIVYFRSKAAPVDFVISVASVVAGNTFTIDSLSLKEITAGDITASGTVQGGMVQAAQDLVPIVRLNSTAGAVSASDALGRLEWYTNDGSTNATGIAAEIQPVAEVTHSGGGNEVGLVFRTRKTGAANAVDVFAIASGGAVGTSAGSLTLANGSNVDVAYPPGAYLRITGPTGAFQLAGMITPPTTVTSTLNYRKTLVNPTGQTFTVNEEDGAEGSTSRRIKTYRGNVVCVVAHLIYDVSISRWVLEGSN